MFSAASVSSHRDVADVLAIVNDNNFGSIGGRNPTLPDYTDFIEVRVPGLDDD